MSRGIIILFIVKNVYINNIRSTKVTNATAIY